MSPSKSSKRKPYAKPILLSTKMFVSAAACSPENSSCSCGGGPLGSCQGGVCNCP